jgi:hypothetical protein
MEEGTVTTTIRSVDLRDGTLACSHCHLPHKVPAKNEEHFRQKAKETGTPLESIWECWACSRALVQHFLKQRKRRTAADDRLFLEVMEDIVSEALVAQGRADCRHEVPPFPELD